MSRIRTSIHGRQLGLDHDNRLLCPEGIVLGRNGSQRTIAGPNSVNFFDDFNSGFNGGTTGRWLATEGTESATSNAAILAGGIGGVLRLTTGAAGTGYAADAEQITQRTLQWQASNGNLNIETRIRLSAITTCYVFFGFTDTVAAALERPIFSASSANTITTTASDAVGFFFDTNMTDDTWWVAGVAADVDAVHQNTGFAPVAATYEVLRIELDTNGTASFYRNGVQVGTAMSGAVTAATDLTPIIAASKLSVTASMTVDLDYIQVGMDR